MNQNLPCYTVFQPLEAQIPKGAIAASQVPAAVTVTLGKQNTGTPGVIFTCNCIYQPVWQQ
jgi:hypothetical protein